MTARLEGTRKEEDYGEDWTDETEENLKTVGRETLIQWLEAIRNGDYCTGSEGTQWNLLLEKKVRKKIF